MGKKIAQIKCLPSSYLLGVLMLSKIRCWNPFDKLRILSLPKDKFSMTLINRPSQRPVTPRLEFNIGLGYNTIL